MFTLIWYERSKPWAYRPEQPKHVEKELTMAAAEARGEEVWKSGQAAYAYIWDVLADRLVWERKSGAKL